MERAIAEMEKIRKAEEIYSRRKNAEEDEKKQPKNIYKKLFEGLFLMNIIIIMIAIQNQNYIFTKEFIEQVNSYHSNFKSKVDSFWNSTSQNPKEVIDSKNVSQNFPKEENKSVSGESNDVNGALVENEVQEEILENLSQEEQDILEIKNNYSIILPILGTKTSGFGERESTNSKVTKYHTGVDIGAITGTVIKSATSGKVIQVSDIGDYGKHIKVQTGNLVVLYAHCSKIYVEEGQEINQGEEIGEVGSTGNSTGPHLHFELRLYDRFVDPESVVEIPS